MKITIKVHRDEILEEHYLPVYRLIKKTGWRWQAIGAGLSLGSGFLAPAVGIVLNLIHSFTRWGFERPALYKLSMILYMLTVPLFMLGAHFLDLMERSNFALRRVETAAVNQPIGHLGLRAKAEESGSGI